MTESAHIAIRPEEWRNRTLADLMQYIVAKHHSYLRAELPVIDALVRNLEIGNSNAAALTTLIRQFRTEMEQHMKKEEAVLFPMIEKLESATSSGEEKPRFPFGSIGHPIAVMEQEHEQARKELAQIRIVTSDYMALPAGRGDEHSVLERLRALDNDMDIHSRLEDEILFPRAIDLEQR